jgi:hypothetical protein
MLVIGITLARLLGGLISLFMFESCVCSSHSFHDVFSLAMVIGPLVLTGWGFEFELDVPRSCVNLAL